jgi:hypothetical protein
MDPLTVLMAALGVGGALLRPVADQAVLDAYNGLKGVLVRKYGQRDPKLPVVLDQHAVDQRAWGALTRQTLADVGADRDQDVINRAVALIKRAERVRPGISGNVIRQINAQGGTVNVVSGHGIVAGRDVIQHHYGSADPMGDLQGAPGWVRVLTVLFVLVALAGFAMAAFNMLAVFSNPGIVRPGGGFPPGLIQGFGVFFTGLILAMVVRMLGQLGRRRN